MALDFFFCLLACCSYHGISFLLLEMTGKRMKSIKCELRKHMVGGSNSVVGASQSCCLVPCQKDMFPNFRQSIKSHQPTIQLNILCQKKTSIIHQAFLTQAVATEPAKMDCKATKLQNHTAISIMLHISLPLKCLK